MIQNKRVALVTGASRGIGEAIALTLAQKGITVIGTATSQIGAEAITAKLECYNGFGYVLDITQKERVVSLIDQIAQDIAPINILINNAGITQDGLLIRMKEEDWDTIMDTNLKSVFRTSSAVLKNMFKAHYGRIINITSIVGTMGNAGQTNYAAAKAGIMGFTKSLAREAGSRNITVNCIAPGFIDTDMTKGLSEEQRNILLHQIPLGRLGQPQDIASAVAFLVSDEAGYITGQTLHINGGMLMP